MIPETKTDGSEVRSSAVISDNKIKEAEEKAKEIVSPFSKKKKLALRFVLFLGSFILFFLVYNLISGFLIYQKTTNLVNDVRILSQAAEAQNLSEIKSEIANTRRSLDSLSGIYKLVSWEGFLPYFGNYISDGNRLIKAGRAGLLAGESFVTAVEPYADLLGFDLENESNVLAATTSAETAKDRIDFIINTIPEILPQIDVISSQVRVVQDEISQINPERYPEKYKEIPIRSQIKDLKNTVAEVSVFLVNGKPLLESAQYLLGMDSPRTYLVLFQNDKEIRPTGGFMTAYSIMTVDKAAFTPVISDDIYTLDARHLPAIKAPEPIIKYIKGPYVLSQRWRLRDMNWSPDFAESMGVFLSAAEKAGISDIDGVIAVDTQLLVNLLDVMGPIGVSGYGNFSTDLDPRCNCPQVIYELESFADVEGPIIWDPITGEIIQRPANSDNRKKIIGPLMNSILANAFGQPKEKIPSLVEAGFKSLVEKHVLFYMFDEEVQKAVADFGIAGTIKDYDGDYLHINDANLGGRKSNLYAYQTVEQDVEIEGNGKVTKTVTITYQNPEKHDGWLNSILPTWVRVYVPKGSSLILAEGLDATTEPYEDLEKTVFAGFFQLRPEGISKITFKYILPFEVTKEYRLFVQKQPGTDGFLYTINLGKRMEEFRLTTDKEIKIEL